MTSGETVCEITRMDVTPLSEAGLFTRWRDRMPEGRKGKIDSLKHAESQRLSLGVGILLFRALEKRGLDPGRERIAENAYGKPYLPDHPEIHFSLSHGGRWALCAVSGCPVGCDVEQIGRGDARLAGRFYHPEEQAALAAAPDGMAWKELFTRLWTRKEAYLKADGRGLSLPMNSFSAVKEGGGVWYDEGPERDGYAFSACVMGGNSRPRFIWTEVRADLELSPEAIRGTVRRPIEFPGEIPSVNGC